MCVLDCRLWTMPKLKKITIQAELQREHTSLLAGNQQLQEAKKIVTKAMDCPIKMWFKATVRMLRCYSMLEMKNIEHEAICIRTTTNTLNRDCGVLPVEYNNLYLNHCIIHPWIVYNVRRYYTHLFFHSFFLIPIHACSLFVHLTSGYLLFKFISPTYLFYHNYCHWWWLNNSQNVWLFHYTLASVISRIVQ